MKIAPLAGEVKTVDIQPGATIREAVSRFLASRIADISLFLDDAPADSDTIIIDPHSIITLIPTVEAGFGKDRRINNDWTIKILASNKDNNTWDKVFKAAIQMILRKTKGEGDKG